MSRPLKPKKSKIFNKNIGIFGSSFDPPHRGHLAVIKHLLAKTDFDELWLIPTDKHPFGKTLSPFPIRLRMVRLLSHTLSLDCRGAACRAHNFLGTACRAPTLKISQIEKTIQKNPTYTWHVIRALKKKYPRFNFTLVVGTDVKRELKKWYKIHELKKMVNFYFIPRKGFEKSSFPKVSSSDIREKSKKGKSIKGLTTKEVERFILKKGLYA